MARGDEEWVEDIISAVADIRADTAGMDFVAFSAKPAIVRSVSYSSAVIWSGGRTSDDFDQRFAARQCREYLRQRGPKPCDQLRAARVAEPDPNHGGTRPG